MAQLDYGDINGQGAEPPMFSVIIPTYNRAHTVIRTIQSVLVQTYQDFEIIIIDDGSTDSTCDVMSSLRDNRIRYYRQANHGRSFARNLGASLAQGEYITFLDSDDNVLPTWLKRLLSVIGSSVGVVCCGAYVHSTNDQSVTQQQNVVLPRSMGTWYDNITALFRPPGTFAIRREVFFTAGAYVNGLEHSENTELGRRITSYCIRNDLAVACVMEPLVHYNREYRFDPNNSKLFEQLLVSNKYMLENHGDALRSAPHRYAYSCAIVGINAARLGRLHEARHYLLQALMNDPLHWKHYVRYLLVNAPVLGRNVWLRDGRFR